MDLGAEQLSPDSVKDKSEIVAAAVVDNDDSVEAVLVTGNVVDSHESRVDEKVGDTVDSKDLNDEGNQNGEQLLWSPSPDMNSASPGAAAGGSVPKKGVGLKRWKRHKKVDLNDSFGFYTGKVLKRGISGINDPPRQRQFGEEKQDIRDFVRPVYILDDNLEALRYFPVQASSSTVFAMGAVSDNSEDQSSMSSTAASAPRHGIRLPLGFLRDKKKPKNPSGKSYNNSTQTGQLGGCRTDPNKKLRGEMVKHKKQISHSSLESDSRSSNFVFIQTSSRRQSEASVNYNQESDEDIQGEPHFTGDQPVYNQANARETEDILSRRGAEFSWKGNEENDGNHQSPTRPDPLVDSIRNLDSVREAVQAELEKLKAIGKESHFTFTDTALSVNSSDYLNGEDFAQNEHDSLNFVEKVTFMESKLEEARDALRIKDMKVCELEATLHSTCLHKGDLNNNTPEQEAAKKLESEIKSLFAEKIEADLKYIVTANALQDAKHAMVNSITMLAEQKTLAEEQPQIMSRLEQTECKAGQLERHAKKLHKYTADIVDSEQALTAHVSLNKLTCYSLAQLLMLLVAIWAVYWQRLSDSGVVVPT